MGYIVQNTETKKYLADKHGNMNLTVAKPELAKVFQTEIEAIKEASNFSPCKLIKV